MQGSVGRNTRLIAGLVQFLNLFMDNSLGPAPTAAARLLGRAPGLGQVALGDDVFIDLIGTSTRPAQTDPEATTTGRDAWDWFRFRVRDYLPLLIVGLVAYWSCAGRWRRRPGSSRAGRWRRWASGWWG